MKLRWSVVFPVAFLLANCAAALATPEAVKLELRSQPGERLEYATEFSLMGDAVIVNPVKPGTPLKLSPQLRGEFKTEQVTRAVAPNGDLDLALKIDGFNVSLNVGNLSASLGIAGEEAGPDRLIKLPEIPLTLTLTPQGKVIGIKGYGDLFKKLGLLKPPAPASTDSDEAKPEPGKAAPDIEAMVKQLLDQAASPMFPANPVKPGDTWSAQANFQIPGMPLAAPLKVKESSRFTGYEEVKGVPCARVDTKMEVVLTMGSGGEAPGLLPMPFTLKEDVEGTTRLFLDPKAGRIVRKEAEGTLSLRVSLQTGTPELAAGDLGKANLRFHSLQELVGVK
jgi:hypothetical protein